MLLQSSAISQRLCVKTLHLTKNYTHNILNSSNYYLKKKITRKYYYYYVHTTKHDQKTLKAVENHIIKKISMKVNYKTLPLQTIHTKKISVYCYYTIYFPTIKTTLKPIRIHYYKKGEFYMDHPVLETIEAYQYYYPIHMVPPITIYIIII